MTPFLSFVHLAFHFYMQLDLSLVRSEIYSDLLLSWMIGSFIDGLQILKESAAFILRAEESQIPYLTSWNFWFVLLEILQLTYIAVFTDIRHHEWQHQNSLLIEHLMQQTTFDIDFKHFQFVWILITLICVLRSGNVCIIRCRIFCLPGFYPKI